MHWKHFFLAALVALGLSCGVVSAKELESLPNRIPDNIRRALERADRIEIYSLKPYSPGPAPLGRFQGVKILGKTVVKDAATIEKLVTAFKKGVDPKLDEELLCYSPHHGLRLTDCGKTIDFVICFSCRQVNVYVNGNEGEGLGFLTDRSPAGAFDAVLKAAKVPLDTGESSEK